MASFSRTLLLISFLFVVVLAVASEVSARDLVETSTETESISENGYHGGHKCKYGKCCKGPHCHHVASEETQATSTVAHTEASGEVENTNAAHVDGYYKGGHKKCKYGKCCKGPHCHGAEANNQN